MPPDEFAAIEKEVEAAYQEHSDGLLRYATKLAGNSDEARDALQEIFLRYFVEQSFGRRIEHPRAWLYRVLRNYVIDHFKTPAFRQDVSSEGMEHLPDRETNPETILQRSELAQEIAAVLSERECDCLRLRSEGLCYADIAEAMGVRAGTVGAMLSRVQKKLRPVARYLTDSKSFEGARLVFAAVQNRSS